MLQQGLICSSRSPFLSLVLLVKKHDGIWRFCVNYWDLNAQNVKDKFPILMVRMHLDDIEKMSFHTHHDHFEFLPIRASTFRSFKIGISTVTCPSIIYKEIEMLICDITCGYLGHIISHDGVTATQSFSDLKLALASAPVMQLPNFEDLFEVECDASGGGIGPFYSNTFTLLLISADSWQYNTQIAMTHDFSSTTMDLQVKQGSQCLIMTFGDSAASICYQPASFYSLRLGQGGKCQQFAIISAYHDNTHEGIQKTLHHIRVDFYWQAMKTSIVAYADISMDFVEGLPQSLGKSILFVDVDRFSMYAHFIPMTHPYTTSRVAHIFLRHIVRLHGIPESIVSDPNDVFTSTFCRELFHLYDTKLKFSSSYHLQTDSQTESTPFSILYGRDPPLLLSYTLGSTRVDSIDQALIERDQVLKNISDRLLKSQVRMKDFYDEGQQDIIYKEVAYQLQLPTTAKLHDVFHVSLLKPFKGLPPSLIPSLPPVDNGWVILTPATVLCANRINNQWEILVQWKDTGQEAATWEQLANFKLVYPTYELEDKLFLQRGGGGCRC
ncbi:uncharacterized protein [Aristolochia californica]|uniref:uncharacterized protein n=1 Tax=Aristolochia californica TaxID=171875 RepID=UPI0035E2084B